MRPCSIAIVTVLLLVLAACKQLDFYDILTSRDLERFAFRHAENPELGFDIAADPASENLAVLPKGIDFSRLIPTYTVDGYALFLDGERIESGSSRTGVSSGDADKDEVTITYTSYSYDGNSETEKIKLERPKAWFSQFAFLAADNEAMAAAGIGDLVMSLDDNEEARAAGDSAEGGMKGSSIWFYLPHSVPVKNLVPSFVKAGNSADIAASATVTLMKGESGDDVGIELVSRGTVLDLSEDRRIRVSVELDGTESIMDYRVALYRLTGLSIPGGENNLGDALYAPEINGDEITVKVPESADVSSLVTDFDFLGYSLTIGDKNFSAKARTNIDYREPVEFVVSTGTGLSHTYTVKVEAQPIVNSVSYNANGGMGDAPADTSTYRYKKSFAVQDHGSLTKSGYTFAGWNTKADGSGTLYQPGDSVVMGTQNVTLYAMWVNVFTVIYYANGGTGSVPVDSVEYRCKSSFTVLGQGSLTKSGYTFAGWNTKADGTGTVHQPGDSALMGTQDVALYSMWRVVKISSITLNRTVINATPGFNPVMLTATIASTDALDSTVSWAVTNGAASSLSYPSETVSGTTVTSSVTVTIAAEGNGVITVTANDGSGVSASCAVTVIATMPVNSVEALAAIGDNPGGNYTIEDDIDLAGADWMPINDFEGTLDGDWHSITGLTVTASSNPNGFFSNINSMGCVKALGIAGNLTSSSGQSGLLAGLNNGTISNCFAEGSITTTSECGEIGGLVGRNTGVICHSFSEVSVCGRNHTGNFVGFNFGGDIYCCYSTGFVVSGGSFVGGFVGCNQGAATISGCFSTGSVSGGAAVGGFVGINLDTSLITNCFYNTESSGYLSGIGIEATTISMKNITTYTVAGGELVNPVWDFTGVQNDDTATADIWSIDPTGVINNGYPYLTKLPPQ